MARLGDVPAVMRSVGPWGLAKRVWHEVGDDHLFTWAAALAYSWLFAVFPFLIFLMSVLPFLPEQAKDRTKVEIYELVHATMPKEAADTIWDNVEQILSKRRHGLLGIGLLLTLWGASAGMDMTIMALDRCYEIENGRPLYKRRPLAILLTIIAATLVLVVVLLLPVGTLVINWAERARPGWVPISFVRYPLSLLVLFTIVHVVYHFGPSIRQRFTFVTPGGVFCVVVWILLGVGFRIYVDRFAQYNEMYGAVGGVAIMLLLFYIDAVVLLVGAEINSEIDFAVLGVPRGSRDFRKARREPAETKESVVRES